MYTQIQSILVHLFSPILKPILIYLSSSILELLLCLWYHSVLPTFEWILFRQCFWYLCLCELPFLLQSYDHIRTLMNSISQFLPFYQENTIFPSIIILQHHLIIDKTFMLFPLYCPRFLDSTAYNHSNIQLSLIPGLLCLYNISRKVASIETCYTYWQFLKDALYIWSNSLTQEQIEHLMSLN